MTTPAALALVLSMAAAGTAAAPDLTTATGKKVPASAHIATFSVPCYDAGKVALDGQPGVLDTVRVLRAQPFGEWNVVYFDPKKTDAAKLKTRLQANGCAHAARVESAAVTQGALGIQVQNPLAAPGDCFQLSVTAPAGATWKFTLPAGWQQVDGERAKGATTAEVYLQSPKKAEPKKLEIPVILESGGERAELKVAVEIAQLVP